MRRLNIPVDNRSRTKGNEDKRGREGGREKHNVGDRQRAEGGGEEERNGNDD